MKRFLIVLMMLMASSAFGKAPGPKYVNIPTFANDETVYMAIRGKQTGRIYETTYVTVSSTQAVDIQFDPDAEVTGYYDAQITGQWSGLSYSYYAGNTFHVPGGSVKITIKVKSKYFVFSGVGTPGAMDVWIEYQE